MRGMLIMFCITTAAAGTFVCVLAARRMVDRGTLLKTLAELQDYKDAEFETAELLGNE